MQHKDDISTDNNTNGDGDVDDNDDAYADTDDGDDNDVIAVILIKGRRKG